MEIPNPYFIDDEPQDYFKVNSTTGIILNNSVTLANFTVSFERNFTVPNPNSWNSSAFDIIFAYGSVAPGGNGTYHGPNQRNTLPIDFSQWFP